MSTAETAGQVGVTQRTRPRRTSIEDAAAQLGEAARSMAESYGQAFVEAFVQASERRLRVLYDEATPALGEAFGSLAAGGEEQLQVLGRVAELVGMEGLDLSVPLPDRADEALAQRIAWRTTARWAVLSLLWTLVERTPMAMTIGDWVAEAHEGDGWRPPGGSGLPGVRDERQALSVVAKLFAGPPIFAEGAGLVLLNRPIVIWAHPDEMIAAYVVRPLALLQTRGGHAGTSIELQPGDRIWPAGSEPEEIAGADESNPSLSIDRGSHDVGDEGVLTIARAVRLSLHERVRAVDVVQGFVLLFEGDAFE